MLEPHEPETALRPTMPKTRISSPVLRPPGEMGRHPQPLHCQQGNRGTAELGTQPKSPARGCNPEAALSCWSPTRLRLHSLPFPTPQIMHGAFLFNHPP